MGKLGLPLMLEEGLGLLSGGICEGRLGSWSWNGS